MSDGKLIAQSGHAYVGSLMQSFSVRPNIFGIYTGVDVATKICLNGGSESKLLNLSEELVNLAIPHRLIYDEGHVELPDFDGSRTLTALGVGPLLRHETPKSMQRLKLWKRPSSQRRLAMSG